MDMIDNSPQSDRCFENTNLGCNSSKAPTLQQAIGDCSGNKAEISVLNTDAEEANNIPKLNEHFEVCKKIHNLNLFYGSIVGLNADHNWRYNNITRWTKFMLILGTSIAVYSHLLVITEPTKLIEVFSLFSIIAPAFAKYNLFLRTIPNALAFVDFIEKLYKEYTEGPKANVLKVHVNEMLVSIKIFVPIQTLALLVFVCYPIYGYVTKHELIQIMPMQFPFIDQSTYGGFIVANLMMMKMGLWAYFGSVGFDLFLGRMIDNYCCLVKLLQQDIAEYIEMSKKNSGYSKKYRRAFLRNFLLKCQDKDRFIQLVNKIYADLILKQFGIMYICLTFTIYAIIRSNWYSGYGILIFCLTEMYILCILGTAISTENKNFCAAIYEIPWYEYPLSEQKDILILLQSSQNAMELWIGPFAPLNVESAMEITKSIYSTSTMIMNTSQ